MMTMIAPKADVKRIVKTREVIKESLMIGETGIGTESTMTRLTRIVIVQERPKDLQDVDRQAAVPRKRGQHQSLLKSS